MFKKKKFETEADANDFMDKVCSRLDNNALRRAYQSSINKHKKKNNDSTLYLVNYFRRKLEERGLGLNNERR